MRISDWSSDVCSSDLQDAARSAAPARPRGPIDMTRTVHCQYENKDAEGLDFVPWPGELGKRVFANVGKAGWAAWLAHQTMLNNENRLSPLDPKHRRSEEHTSELQSLMRISYAVFCLQKKTHHNTT